MNEQEFLDCMAKAATGVTVVATDGAAGRAGLTVSAFTSVSASPPLLLVCINRKSASVEQIGRNGRFSVSILAEGQENLSEIFAGRAGVEREQGFADPAWVKGEMGLPVLTSAAACFECEVENATDAGTHRIFLGRVLAARHGASRALAYSRRGYRRLSD